jgi:dephospho-CoA kinase
MPRLEPRRPLRILLTGPSGAGKSSLCKAFARRGWKVLDGDALAKSLYRPGSRLLTSIAAAFGKTVLRPDGTLDTVRLGEIVFPSLAQRRRLNRLVYPRFWRAVQRVLKSAGRRPLVADIAVYFDAGAPRLGCYVVLVQTPLAERIRRLKALGLTPARAAARARALRFGPRERRASDLVLDGREPVAANVRKILALLSRRRTSR